MAGFESGVLLGSPVDGLGGSETKECIVKGCLVMGRFGEDTSVKVDQTEIAAEFAGGARDRLESGDAFGERAETRAGYFVSEEGYGGEGDLALLDADMEAVVQEASEKLTKVITIPCGVPGEYEDVVEIGEDEIESLGNFVDETFEGLSGVLETKTYEGKFEQAKRGDDSGFGAVGFVDRDLGIDLDQVDYGEDIASKRRREQSWMCFAGYLSGMVRALRYR